MCKIASFLIFELNVFLKNEARKKYYRKLDVFYNS